MTWSREIIRRLFVFYIILCGSLAIGRALEGYIMEYYDVPLSIAGPINMCLFLYVLIKTVGYLKFERIK